MKTLPMFWKSANDMINPTNVDYQDTNYGWKEKCLYKLNIFKQKGGY